MRTHEFQNCFYCQFELRIGNKSSFASLETHWVLIYYCFDSVFDLVLNTNDGVIQIYQGAKEKIFIKEDIKLYQTFALFHC